jgi:hypothetical protein
MLDMGEAAVISGLCIVDGILIDAFNPVRLDFLK